MEPKALSAGTITGDAVRNRLGEDLGHIKDIMIDVQEGRIAYAVLSFGGILGIGDKLFAVPWKALELRPEERTFYLDVDKDRLENAPGFDKDNWPMTLDRDFMTEVHSYYGVDPYWSGERGGTTGTRGAGMTGGTEGTYHDRGDEGISGTGRRGTTSGGTMTGGTPGSTTSGFGGSPERKDR